MTIRTAKQLRENLEKIRAQNKIKVEQADAVYFDLLTQGLDTTKAKADCEQAQRVAEHSEALAEKSLKVAEDRELKESQTIEETRKRTAAELESRQRFRAERTWIASGGEPKDFEKAWEAIREKLLENAVLQTANEPETTQIVHSL